MRFLKHYASALALSALAVMSLSAGATPADPKNGVEYKTLPAAQPTEPGKKIEVTEFFDYACPHCFAFDPALSAWVKKQGDNIVFKRMHISRSGTDLPQEKMFFTLEAMGLLTPAMHEKIFQEMHVNRNRMNRDELVFDFVAKQGVDRQKFIETYRGFGVAGRVRKSLAMMDAYQVDSWPMIAIDGRFITSPSMADEGQKTATTETQLHSEALQVMDVLVAKSKAEKK
jgi:thiol:disulfide interchange protein DsbA